MDVKGKVVIVTGASSGIGEATVRQFGREGAKVVLAARRVDRTRSACPGDQWDGYRRRNAGGTS